MKKIYLLIGQKGAGKTFIGSLFEKFFSIKFIRVENWAKDIQKNREATDKNYVREVFGLIEKGIRKELEKNDKLVFESTGLTDDFDTMLRNFRTDFKVITINVIAEPELCVTRVHKREQSLHINVSDKLIKKINEAVVLKNLECDYIIDNNSKTIDQIKDEIKAIVS